MNINYFDCLATSPGHLSCDWLALRSVAIFMYTFNICCRATFQTVPAPATEGGNRSLVAENNPEVNSSAIAISLFSVATQ